MKYIIDATEYAAITDDATKAMYKQAGDQYVVHIEGLPDVDGLTRRNAELLDEKKKAATAQAEAAAAAKKAADDLARKNGDFESIENGYKQQLADMQAGFNAERDSLNGSLSKHLIGNVAQQLATELCGANAALIMPHILPRLSVESVNGQHVTRVLGADGKPSALDIPGLAKEFGGNKLYAAILKGPGSQGTPVDPNPGAQPADKSMQQANPMLASAMAAIDAMPEA